MANMAATTANTEANMADMANTASMVAMANTTDTTVTANMANMTDKPDWVSLPLPPCRRWTPRMSAVAEDSLRDDGWLMMRLDDGGPPLFGGDGATRWLSNNF